VIFQMTGKGRATKQKLSIADARQILIDVEVGSDGLEQFRTV
jgi:hypothetical protein